VPLSYFILKSLGRTSTVASENPEEKNNNKQSEGV